MHYCTVTGVDFTGAQFDGTDLTGVDLTECNIAHTARPFSDFPDKPTILTDAKINLSQLGLDWSNTKLVNTTIVGLHDGAQPQLDGLIAQNATIQSINLNHASLKGAKFDYSTLTDLQFNHAKLYKASFSDASLTGNICECTRVDFSFADLTRAVFNRAIMNSCQFVAATMLETQLVDATLGGATHIAACDLSYASINNANFKGIKLTGASLANATIQGAMIDFSGDSSLELTDFSGAYLIELSLSGAKLMGAKMDGACLLHAKLDGADFSPANEGANPSSLVGAYLQGVTFSVETNFDSAGLSNAVFDFSRGTLKVQYCNNGEITPPQTHYYDATPPSNQLQRQSMSGQTTCPNGQTLAENEGLSWTDILQLGKKPKPWRPESCSPQDEEAVAEGQIEKFDEDG
ncbi:MAG: pentapeptide repeat-containing protein [Alphaproteobacteria bacterium]|nr:pentapeptide repeat-containing protein [Alphaproteobacteria bacterium]